MRLDQTKVWLALLAIVAAGLFVRGDNLGLRSFSVDETLQVLAARSLLATGAPTLPSGDLYTRALPVTHAVALAFSWWGESEAAARAPSVVAGTLAIPAAYLLGARLFGPVAGLLAAFLVAFSPDAVAMSRFVRMYAPTQTLVILGAWALACALLPATDPARPQPARRRLFAGAAGLALLLLATRLHMEVSLLAPAIALYLALVALAVTATQGVRAALRTPEACLLGAGALLAVLVVLAAPDVVSGSLRRGLTRLPWFPAEAWDPRFYDRYLADTYGYLWFLAAPATIAALVTRFRAGLFAALLFAVPFACLSVVVPTQSERYLFVFLPFLFVLLAQGGRLAGGLLLERLEARLAAGLPWPAPAQVTALLVFAATLGLVVRASPWFASAQANRLKPAGSFAGAAYHHWREVGEFVRARGGGQAAVIAGADQPALYYIGRLDGRLLYTNQGPHPGDRDVERTPGGWRFRSYTTGVAAFTDVEDLAAAIARHPRGFVIVERSRFVAYPEVLAPGVTSFLARKLTRETTPADETLVVFGWDEGRHADAAGRAR